MTKRAPKPPKPPKPRPICFICFQQSAQSHSHHVTMQAKTGDAGPLVDLCGTCHTELHAIALAQATVLKGGKTKTVATWQHARHPTEQHRAQQLIEQLVRVLLSNLSTGVTATSLSIPHEFNQGLKLLQLHLGLTNKQDTILFCIRRTLMLIGAGPIKRRPVKAPPNPVKG